MDKIEEILNDNSTILDWKDEQIKELRDDRDYWRNKFDALLKIIMNSKSSEIKIIQNNK